MRGETKVEHFCVLTLIMLQHQPNGISWKLPAAEFKGVSAKFIGSIQSIIYHSVTGKLLKVENFKEKY